MKHATLWAAAVAAVALFMFFAPGARVKGVIPATVEIAAGDDSAVAPATPKTRPTATGRSEEQAKPVAAEEKADIVEVAGGDRLTGTVVGIDSGGKLHLKSSHFESEVVVAAGAVESVILSGGQMDAGSDVVAMTNGDLVCGNIMEISADGVVVETQAAGRIRILLKMVSSISPGLLANVLLQSDFAAGRIDPWVSQVPEVWSVADGALICSKTGGVQNGNVNTSVYAKLDQKQAVTLVAKVQAVKDREPVFCLVIFSDTTKGNPFMWLQGNSLVLLFHDGQAELQYVNTTSIMPIANHKFAAPWRGGIVRLAYDPATAKARIWADANDLGLYEIPGKPAAGQYVLIDSHLQLRVDYLKVLRGIVPPSVEGEVGADARISAPDDANVAVQFANKDRVSALKIAMADGQMILTTPHGEIKCPPTAISRLVFGKKGFEEPARAKDGVRVRTGVCSLTLQFDRLTADFLVGHSECYGGEVKIRRSAVRDIRFSLPK